MSGPAELAIAAGVLLDAGIKATLVLGVGWAGASWAERGSAAQRHAIWAATLGALPLLPLWAASRGPEIAVDAPWLVVGWASGAALCGLPLLRGLLELHRLRRRAAPIDEPGVLLVDDIDGPLTWGLLRPVIALPRQALDWRPSDRHAALAHERAHVARRDWAVDVTSRLIASAFWFHPLVWWARARLAAEAEHAADDQVLAEGVRASAYAELLLSLAHAPRPTLALGAASPLGRRVHAVLDARPRSPHRAPILVIACALNAAALPALSAWPVWTAPPETLTCAPGPLP